MHCNLVGKGQDKSKHQLRHRIGGVSGNVAHGNTQLLGCRTVYHIVAGGLQPNVFQFRAQRFQRCTVKDGFVDNQQICAFGAFYHLVCRCTVIDLIVAIVAHPVPALVAGVGCIAV